MRKVLGNVSSTTPQHGSGALLEFIGMAWRAALPVAFLTSFGAALDSKMVSAPWFMLIGASLGLLLSIFLIGQLGRPKSDT